MLTLLFRCPRCRMDCICGMRSGDDIFAFCAGVPVRLACWVCGTHSFVMHPRLRLLPNGAKAEHFLEGCLKCAAECHQQAIFAPAEAARRPLLRLENYWLALSQCAAVPGALVAARGMRVADRVLVRQETGGAASPFRASEEPVRLRSAALNGVQP